MLLNATRESVSIKSSSGSSDTQQVASTPSVKLPRLDIPKFNGNYQEWISVHDLFNALVNQHEGITDVQRLQYLKGCIDGEPARMIQSLKVSDANFKEAWKLLVDCYENKRQIVRAHLKEFFNYPCVSSDNPLALRRFLDNTIEQLRALNVLGRQTDAWDDILVYWVSEKLDQETRKEWAMFNKSNDLSTFEELKSFSEARCRALDESQINTKSSKWVQQSNKFNKQVSLANSNGCIMCSDSHPLHSCDNFKGLNVENKREMVAKNVLCFNCLRTGHQVNQCRSKFKCRECNKAHHTSLHLNKSSSNDKGADQKKMSDNDMNVQTSSVNMHITNETEKNMVLLSTASVIIYDTHGSPHTLRALLDSGSQLSFITKKVVDRLRLQPERSDTPIKGIGLSACHSNSLVRINIHSTTSDFNMQVDARILPKITMNLPAAKFSNIFKHISGIKLADTKFNEPGPIDLLLLNNVFNHIINGKKINGGNGQPNAIDTQLGWILGGEVNVSPNYVTHHAVMSIDSQLRKFWNIEEIPSDVKAMSKDEKWSENHFVETYKRNANGRFIIKLPFKLNPNQLGSSKNQALNRYIKMETKISRDPLIKKQYDDFLSEYMMLGHMKLAQDIDKPASVNYLPHHYVMKESSTTTKLRLVFDASAKTTTGFSLNDVLHTGAKTQDDLIHILMQARTHKYLIMGDCAKLYRQILVEENDQDFQRIFWKSPNDDTHREYKLTTVTYGTRPAAFLATRCIKQLAIDEAARYTKASQVVRKDFYMDDLITGSDDIDEAKGLLNEVIALMSTAGFEIRKWVSNSQPLLDVIPEEKREIKSPLKESSVHFHALGIKWNLSEDSFYLNINLSSSNSVTERALLADIALIFDPFGWVAPCVIRAEILLQHTWLSGLNWDDTLDELTLSNWLQLRNDMKQLRNVSVPRRINCGAEIELHAFCDASQLAYGTVVYIVTRKNNVYQSKLFASKTRVAPIKTLTLPRLELCGAVLLSKLVKCIKQYVPKLKNAKVFAWSDSTVTLEWIKGHPAKWKTFVGNRVSEIQDVISPENWRHVKSEDNPPDLAFRGVSPTELIASKMWWNGPKWLQTNDWPEDVTIIYDEKVMKEAKKTKVTLNAMFENSIFFDRYSSLERLVRIMSRVLRFIKAMRKQPKCVSPLTPSEMDDTLMRIIKIAQSETFYKEIKRLMVGQTLKPTSNLIHLSVFLDENGIMRVGEKC